MSNVNRRPLNLHHDKQPNPVLTSYVLSIMNFTGNQGVGEQTSVPAEATEWSRGYAMEGHVQEEPTLVAREATDSEMGGGA